MRSASLLEGRWRAGVSEAELRVSAMRSHGNDADLASTPTIWLIVNKVGAVVERPSVAAVPFGGSVSQRGNNSATRRNWVTGGKARPPG